MKESIEILQMRLDSLQHCLNDKTWASGDYDEHNRTRKEYEQRVNDFKKALKILKQWKET